MATVLGSSIAFIDGSVVNVALPAIQRDLSASAADIQWLINGYLLPLSAFVLVGGALGDRLGRRRMFVSGVAVFAVGSLLCALAPGFVALLAARGVQGIGAAVLIPTSLALLGAGFTGDARGQAIGTWAAAGAITAAAGPVIGGWLVDTVGWRAIFVINLPIAAAAIWLALRYVTDARDSTIVTPIDWRGAALVASGLGAVAWALTVLPTRGGEPLVLATLAGGAVALVAFVAVERRRGAEAMMPLALFDSRTFVGVTLLTLFLYGALNGLVVLLPYLLIRIAHYPAPAAGAALLPLPIVMGVGSRTVGRLAERTGPRLPLTIGPLIVAIGFVLGRRLGPGHFGYWSDVFPVAFTFAVGMTLSVAPLTATVLAAVDRQHAGSASGVNDATAYVAGLIVTALLGLVLVAAGSVGTFMPRFHVAMVAGAMLALAATASARLFIS